MTDTEIIKALECCGGITDGVKECSACPLLEKSPCTTDLSRNALDLINRLKADNWELKQNYIPNFKYALRRANEIGRELDLENVQLIAEIERLNNHIRDLTNMVKSEARKEFAEQLEAEIISSDKYIREYDDSEVQKAYNKGLRDALKILKEMG